MTVCCTWNFLTQLGALQILKWCRLLIPPTHCQFKKLVDNSVVEVMILRPLAFTTNIY